MNKVALILEGGGLRGIFTAGVIDCFLDHNINFDYVVGVSAGACNTFAFLGKEKKYIKSCMIQDSPFDSFYGVYQMLDSHKIIDLDKVFYDYTKKYNFDFETFINNDTKWQMAVSNIITGKAEYMSTHDIEMAKLIGKASCSLPIITEPVKINGNLYLDGGVCDPIPIYHTLQKGYDKVVVVLTRKKGNYSVTSEATKMISKRLYNDYPNFIEAINARTQLYKDEVTKVEELERQGSVILIRPTMQEVGRLESNTDQLSLSYYHGYTKSKEKINDIKQMIGE